MQTSLKKYLEPNKDGFYLNEFGELKPRSVHCKNDKIRIEKAEEQASLSIVPIEQIISYVNEFLNELGVDRVEIPQKKIKNMDLEKFYNDLKIEYNLKHKKDIIWMKFTNDGYLGVIARGNDINFDIPPSADVYHERIKRFNIYENKEKYEWKYNTSGIIIHKCGQTWDDENVLVFPLKNIPAGIDVDKIETGIGNYLTEKGVPILDFYSHNF